MKEYRIKAKCAEERKAIIGALEGLTGIKLSSRDIRRGDNKWKDQQDCQYVSMALFLAGRNTTRQDARNATSGTKSFAQR